MSEILLLCVGKLKEKFYIQAFEEYSKRLGAFCKFSCTELQEIRLSDAPSEKEISQALDKEGEKILSLIPKDSYVISMCVEGKKLSSEQLSSTVDECFLSGKSRIVFIIGGSFGLSPRVKGASNMRLSMSDMTFPHHLARIMLAEQIYRAFKIIAGSKYHK